MEIIQNIDKSSSRVFQMQPLFVEIFEYIDSGFPRFFKPLVICMKVIQDVNGARRVFSNRCSLAREYPGVLALFIRVDEALLFTRDFVAICFRRILISYCLASFSDPHCPFATRRFAFSALSSSVHIQRSPSRTFPTLPASRVPCSFARLFVLQPVFGP